jgi:hypothetical protein
LQEQVAKKVSVESARRKNPSIHPASAAAAAQFCDVLPTKVEAAAAAAELRTGGALVFVPLFVIPFSFC